MLIQQVFVECLPYVPVTVLSLQEFISNSICKATLLLEFTFW